MGTFSFTKDAGKNQIFHSHDEHSALEKLDETRNSQPTAEQLKQAIEHYKLSVENLKITIDEDMAVVYGKAQDQSIKEKVVLLIGNTAGIASVDDQMTVDHAENESHFHCVEKEDTLDSIAKHYYDDSTKRTLILNANAPLLQEAKRIYLGQVLRIPNIED